MALEYNDRTLALAGVFQAAALVKTLSKTGRIEPNAFLSSINSLFSLEASGIENIYPEPQHLEIGLTALVKLLKNDKQPKDAEIVRYAFSLLHLEKKLSKNNEMLAVLRKGIERATLQAKHFHPTHDNVMANLASLYTDTLSTFSFRIQVTGNPLYLQQTHYVNKVRALLLAGVRAAVLWKQLGGRRWHLLLSRNSILEAAEALLERDRVLS